MRTRLQLLPVGLFIGFLFLLAGSLLILPSFGLNPVLGALVVIGLALVSPLISNPRMFFWVYFIWAWILRCVQSFFSLARFGDEALILLWMLILVGALAFKHKLVKDRWFLGMFGGLLLVCVFSWFANGSNPKKAVLFFLSYLVPVFTFFFARNYLNKKKDLLVFVKVMGGLFCLQLVLNLGWMLRINPLPNPWLYTHDFAIGSMYSQTNVAYFCSFLLVTLVGGFFQVRSNRGRLWISVCFVLVLLQLILTYTLHVYLVLAVGIGVYLLLFSGKKIFLLAPITALVGVVVVVSAINLSKAESFEATEGQSLVEEVTVENLRVRWEKMALGPKGQCYADAFYYAPSEKPIRWLVGAGPGDFISTVAMFQQPYSELTLRYLGKYYLTFTGERERQGKSVTQAVVSSPATLMGELGGAGLLLYVGLYVILISKILKNIYEKRYSDRLQLILAQGFVASTSMLLLLGLLVDVIDTDSFMVAFWTAGALLITPVSTDDEQGMLELSSL